MWQWLRTTRLATQLSDIISTHRALRQAEHRYSLRTKRAAVKSRIIYEIHRTRIQDLYLQLLNARLLNRYHASKRLITAYEAREQKLEQLLKQHALPMPEKQRPVPTNDSEDDFKDRLFRNVENIMGDGGVVGKTLAKDALKESFGNVRVRGSESDMAVGLVAGVAKEIGLSRQELNGLFEMVERDGGDVGLRAAVMDAMEKENAPSSSR